MPGDERTLSLADFERIKAMLVDPIVSAQNIHHAQIEREIAGLRQDYRDGLKDLRAILSTIQDPETGYVPRVQVSMLFENVGREIGDLRTYVDGQVRSLRDETAHEFAERDGDKRTSISTILTAIGIAVSALLSAVSLGMQFLSSHHR